MVKKYYPDSDDIRLLVSRGLVIKSSATHKFGAVPAMSQNQTGSIWDINDTLYPWNTLDTPAVINVEVTNGDDVGHTVTVQGLDGDYNFVEETIVTTGTDTLGTVLFKRVNRAFCTAGGATNAGNINIEAGAAGGTTVARITATKAQTLMAVYTVPAGKTAYLYNIKMTAQSSADANGNLFIRKFGEDTFRIQHSFEVTGDGGMYDYSFNFPIPIPEKSDVDVRATTRTNNGRYTAAFDILLIDNSAES